MLRHANAARLAVLGFFAVNRLQKAIAVSLAVFACAWLVAGYVSFPPKSSADVAGWAQAGGSLAAIALAVYLQYRASTESSRQALLLSKAFSGQLILGFRAMVECCESQTFIEFKTQRHVLHDALRIGEKLPLSGLAPYELAKVFTLRRVTISALSETEGHTEGGGWAYQVIYWKGVHAEATKIFEARSQSNPVDPAKKG